MALSFLLALAVTSTSGGGLAVGDPIPTWRQPVVNAARFGRPTMDLREYYRGGLRAERRLFVTFGASWCEPCKREITALSGARDALAAAGVDVAIVVADEQVEGRAKMVDWLTKELDVPFAVVVDELGILRRRYRADRLPAAYLADSKGALVMVGEGFEEEVLAKLTAPRGTAR